MLILDQFIEHVKLWWFSRWVYRSLLITVARTFVSARIVFRDKFSLRFESTVKNKWKSHCLRSRNLYVQNPAQAVRSIIQIFALNYLFWIEIRNRKIYRNSLFNLYGILNRIFRIHRCANGKYLLSQLSSWNSKATCGRSISIELEFEIVHTSYLLRDVTVTILVLECRCRRTRIVLILNRLFRTVKMTFRNWFEFYVDITQSVKSNIYWS